MVVKVKVKGSVLYKKIGERIHTARIKKGMTQDQLAEDSGLDRTYLSQVENGERNVSAKSLAILSRVLKIDFSDELMGRKTKSRRKRG